jgi:two-component system alkaline phosphatase synthesis response regulator PhoP
VKTILVVDDEPQIAEIASDYLRLAGFDVIVAGDGVRALEAARGRRPDLVVLDLGLPRLDGLDVARTMRRESDVPIIMLTARVEEDDRLRGLEIGADDYITKPFSPRELVARVRAVLRRSEKRRRRATATFCAADLVIDAPACACARDEPIDLTPTEFQLLATLARHPGRVFTRAQLLDAVRGSDAEAFERAIDSHIKNIRRKLERRRAAVHRDGVRHRLQVRRRMTSRPAAAFRPAHGLCVRGADRVRRARREHDHLVPFRNPAAGLGDRARDRNHVPDRRRLRIDGRPRRAGVPRTTAIAPPVDGRRRARATHAARDPAGAHRRSARRRLSAR